MDERVSKSKVAERLLTRPGGATMREIIAATGGPQYNELNRLSRAATRSARSRKAMRRVTSRPPPEAVSFDATVTSKGQVTLPKEVRARLGVRAGGRLRFAVEDGDRVVISARPSSIQDSVRHARQAAASRDVR